MCIIRYNQVRSWGAVHLRSPEAGDNQTGRVYVYSGLTGGLLRTFDGEATFDGFRFAYNRRRFV